jgi:DNA-binding HxlR family transcriptional regulator
MGPCPWRTPTPPRCWRSRATRAAQPCGVETTLSVIEGRWKLLILFQLLGGTKRFGELKKRLSGVTQRMLTLHLRELERDGLIHREVYREVPPKVEYSLTQMGRSLEPLLHIMSEWGHGHRAALVKALRQAAGSAAADPSASWPVSRPSVAARASRPMTGTPAMTAKVTP